ncbi:MAG: methyl-accepting chemotaxis protein [Deltaproteobacteria bacterium]|nr:methyl-accepting chemotaxis protein [Deltaproteobacteria bacterium]
MIRRNMSVGKRIMAGFGLVLCLFVVIVILSYGGIEGIMDNAKGVIDGNKLYAFFAQVEVDQLNWAKEINAFLTNESITELKVETDEKKSAFGMWLQSQARKDAEGRFPALAPLFNSIETTHKSLLQSAVHIRERFHRADPNLPTSLTELEMNLLAWLSELNKGLMQQQAEFTVELDENKCPVGRLLNDDAAMKALTRHDSLAKLIAPLKELHEKLHRSVREIQRVYAPVDPAFAVRLQQIMESHRKWTLMVCMAIVEGAEELGVSADLSQDPLGRLLVSDQAAKYAECCPTMKAPLDEMKKAIEKEFGAAKEIEKALSEGNKVTAKRIFSNQFLPGEMQLFKHFEGTIGAHGALLRQDAAREVYKTQTLTVAGQMRELLQKARTEAQRLLEGVREGQRTYALETIPALEQTQSILRKICVEIRKHTGTDVDVLEKAKGTKRNVILVGILAIGTGLLLAFLITKGIATLLKGLTNHVRQVAGHVALASSRVLSSSHSLAEAGAEQLAFIEEASSAMEQMASMTMRNTENTRQTDELMEEANIVVNTAGRSMADLTTSMEQISTSSDETSRIVKTIDAIAFQTNILALNAAIEAARYGEAGAGFAVVANEVKSLAVRSSEAASSTSELIEGMVVHIKEGVALVRRTTEAFSRVAAIVAKVKELIGEINLASHEQTKEIGQIVQAVADIEKGTQATVANSDRNTAVAEEMAVQAREMEGTVERLVILTGKSNDNGGGKIQETEGFHEGSSAAAPMASPFLLQDMRYEKGCDQDREFSD